MSRWTVAPDDRERLTIPLCAKHLKRVRNSGDLGYEHRGLHYRVGFW